MMGSVPTDAGDLLPHAVEVRGMTQLDDVC